MVSSPRGRPSTRRSNALAGVASGRVVRVMSRSVSRRPPVTVGPNGLQNAPSAVTVSSAGISSGANALPECRGRRRGRAG